MPIADHYVGPGNSVRHNGNNDNNNSIVQLPCCCAVACVHQCSSYFAGPLRVGKVAGVRLSARPCAAFLVCKSNRACCRCHPRHFYSALSVFLKAFSCRRVQRRTTCPRNQSRLPPHGRRSHKRCCCSRFPSALSCCVCVGFSWRQVRQLIHASFRVCKPTTSAAATS